MCCLGLALDFSPFPQTSGFYFICLFVCFIYGRNFPALGRVEQEVIVLMRKGVSCLLPSPIPLSLFVQQFLLSWHLLEARALLPELFSQPLF